jgi:hypothetical protein
MAKRMKENLNEDIEPMSELEKNLHGIELPDSPDDSDQIEGDGFDMYGRNQDDEDDDFADMDDTPLDMDSIELADDDMGYDEDDDEYEEEPHQEEIKGVENLGVIDDDDEELAKKVIKNYLRDARDSMMELIDFLTHSDYTHIGNEELIKKRLDKAYAIHDEITNFFKDE